MDKRLRVLDTTSFVFGRVPLQVGGVGFGSQLLEVPKAVVDGDQHCRVVLQTWKDIASNSCPNICQSKGIVLEWAHAIDASLHYPFMSP